MILLSIQLCLAQDKLITGTVIDANSLRPISYATVALRNNDSIVDGTITNNKGIFRLRTVRGFNSIEVGFLGYEATILDPALLDLETISVALEPTDYQIEGVAVIGERTTSSQQIDRRIINLGSDIQQAGTTALEALDQITEIQTDLSTGTISLRGNSDIRLLINGKPSGLNSGELLGQIPSATIDRIEIISAPSAKEQADGISGIVNIILKKSSLEGINLNLNSGFGSYRHNYGLHGNLNKDWFNLRLLWNIDHQDRTSYQNLERIYNNNSTESIFTPHEYDGKVQQVSLGFDFFPNDKNEFSLDWNYTDDYHSFYNPSRYTNITDQDDFEYLRTSEHFHYTNTFNANLRHKFKNENHFLEVDYNLNDNNNSFPAEDFRNDVFQLKERYDYDNTLHFLGIDYSLPITEKMATDSGFSWNGRKLTSDYAFSDNDLESLDTFDYREDILAIYGQLRWNLTNLRVQAGLRYEHFWSNGLSTREPFTSSKEISTLFPSLHLSYTINDDHELNIGLSRRTARPNFRHLNPFQLGNPYFAFEGNPDLRPEFSTNVELNYQYNLAKINVSLSGFYRFRNAVIQRIDHFNVNRMQVVGYINGGNNTSIGIEGSLAYKVFPFWDTTLSVNYFTTYIEKGQLVTFDRLFSSTLQLKNNFKISEALAMDISYRYNPKRQQAFRFYKPRNRIDWAIRGRFFEKKLTLGLRVVDVFNDNLQLRTTITNTVFQKETWDFATQTRNYLFSVSYQLFQNKTLSRNRKKRDYRHGGTTD